MFEDFKATLRHRAGGQRLANIDVYHDFEWSEVFPSIRSEFRNGKRLALLVKADCPPGKTPVLVLTNAVDAEEVTFETVTEYVSVVRIDTYLRDSKADPAISYYGRKFAKPTRAAFIREFERNREIRADLVGSLEVEDVVAWLRERPERRAAVDSLVNTSIPDRDGLESARQPAFIAERGNALGGLRLLERLDLPLALELARLLRTDVDPDALAAVVEALASSSIGRSLSQIQLALHLADRLRDLQTAAAAYSQLLRSPEAGETELHGFIVSHPWLLGLDYVRVRAEKTILRGRADFLLERYDGFHDLLELKDPSDPIVVAPDIGEDGPPSATMYSLSPGLANALAQAHVYKRNLTVEESAHKAFGLSNTRDPQIYIVIGRAELLPEHRIENLVEINKSLHRVSILPYDWLAERADYFVANLEKHLQVVAEESVGDKARG